MAQAELQSEDSLSFLSAIIGALGSTLTQQTGSQKALLFGLVLAAVSKALPSLADKKTSKKDWKEDSILFAGGFLALLAAGIQSDWTFSNPSSLVSLLLLSGIILKTIPSLMKKPRKTEDLLALIIASFTLLLIPLAPQYALAGAFLSFLVKTLTSSSSTKSPTGH